MSYYSPYYFQPYEEYYDDDHLHQQQMLKLQRERQRRAQERAYYEQLARQQHYADLQRQYAARQQQIEQEKRRQAYLAERERAYHAHVAAERERERRRLQKVRAREAQRVAAVERQARENALREQFAQHNDPEVACNFLDILDYLGLQAKPPAGAQEEAKLQDSSSEEEEGEPQLASILEPASPVVFEPQSPNPEVEEQSSEEEESSEEADEAEEDEDEEAIENDLAEKLAELEIEQGADPESAREVKLLQPRLALEQDRFDALSTREVQNRDEAVALVKALQEAHLRVEQIYTKLDSFRVDRSVRKLKHELTTSSIGLAEKIDDALANAKTELAKYPAPEPAVKPKPKQKSKPKAKPKAKKVKKPKHHVTLEEVEDESS